MAPVSAPRVSARRRRRRLVCKGFDPARVEIAIRELPTAASRPSEESPAKIRGRSLFLYVYNVRVVSSRSGMDSDLEAFSHYPADGSVAALPGRTTAKTNYLNQRFLSY
ncbi:hypothetical protein VTK56DRAFT_6811 [Thermocarpiscus australiensis]